MIFLRSLRYLFILWSNIIKVSQKHYEKWCFVKTIRVKSIIVFNFTFWCVEAHKQQQQQNKWKINIKSIKKQNKVRWTTEPG